jgi:hypothetical protein
MFSFRCGTLRKGRDEANNPSLANLRYSMQAIDAMNCYFNILLRAADQFPVSPAPVRHYFQRLTSFLILTVFEKYLQFITNAL